MMTDRVTHIDTEISIGMLAEAMALTNNWSSWAEVPPSIQDVYLDWSERIIQKFAK